MKYYMTAQPIIRGPNTKVSLWLYDEDSGWRLLRARKKHPDIYGDGIEDPEFNCWSREFEFNIILPSEAFLELL